MQAEEWSGPRAPMFFEGGTIFTDRGWASIHVHEGQLRAALDRFFGNVVLPRSATQKFSNAQAVRMLPEGSPPIS
jgi:hypothetical protein